MGRFMRVTLLLVTATIIAGGALKAQAIGDPAPNKTFLSSWSTPAGVDEIVDYPGLGTDGKLLLLDWFAPF
jgi:hypothetical protein